MLSFKKHSLSNIAFGAPVHYIRQSPYPNLTRGDTELCFTFL